MGVKNIKLTHDEILIITEKRNINCEKDKLRGSAGWVAKSSQLLYSALLEFLMKKSAARMTAKRGMLMMATFTSSTLLA